MSIRTFHFYCLVLLFSSLLLHLLMQRGSSWFSHAEKFPLSIPINNAISKCGGRKKDVTNVYVLSCISKLKKTTYIITKFNFLPIWAFFSQLGSSILKGNECRHSGREKKKTQMNMFGPFHLNRVVFN